MQNLNELELQNIRHLMGAHCTIEKKLKFYAEQCNDPKIKNMMLNDSNDAKKSKEQLKTFLS